MARVPGNFRYLLVLVDPFSGCIETLLTEIIPRFGLPGSLQSNNGPAFVSQVMKGIMSTVADLALSLETSIVGDSRKIQSDFEMGLSQAMSRNSRRLD